MSDFDKAWKDRNKVKTAQEKMERIQLCDKARTDLEWAAEELVSFSTDIPNIVVTKDFTEADMRIKGFNQKVKTAFTLITARTRVFDWLENFLDHNVLIKYLKFDDFNKPTFNNDLYLTDQKEVIELPSSLTIKGTLGLKGTGVKKLPRNLTVRGTLDISDTNITELPVDLNCNTLACSYKLKDIAEQAVADGRIRSKNVIYNDG